jgi:hypothetical protein
MKQITTGDENLTKVIISEEENRCVWVAYEATGSNITITYCPAAKNIFYRKGIVKKLVETHLHDLEGCKEITWNI